MIAWEGWSEAYRDGIYFAGGIPETSFCRYWINKIQTGRNKTEDIIRLQREHPLLDEYWKVREVDLEAINVPSFVVADWGCDLHTRGTIEAYKRISSEHKWLEVHGRKKWGYFYEGHAVRRQLAFMDRFLHGKGDNEVKEWPKVRVEVRERYYYGTFIDENEWPIATTRYERMYLDIPNKKLATTSPSSTGEAKYDSTNKTDRLVFRHTFKEDVALVGHAKIHLSVALPDHDDGDVFAGLRKIDRLGNVINFVFFTVHECGPLTIGCQRVNHRELVPEKSTECQPFQRHSKLQKLGAENVTVESDGSSLELLKSKDKFCQLDIELLPFTGRIRHGESIELVIQGSDIVQMEPALVQKHEDTVNKGDHIVYSGGRCESYIVLPFLDDLKLGTPWGGLP
jgi:predicted acyl esterase